MIAEANDFIERMRNYQFIHPVDVHDDEELKKIMYKRKIDECYSFIKYLNCRKDSLMLAEEKRAVQEIQNEIVEEYINWKRFKDGKQTN